MPVDAGGGELLDGDAVAARGQAARSSVVAHMLQLTQRIAGEIAWFQFLVQDAN